MCSEKVQKEKKKKIQESACAGVSFLIKLASADLQLHLKQDSSTSNL